MKTLKAIAGLMAAPVLVVLAEAGVTLLPCDRHDALRQAVYAGLRADVRTLCGRK